MKWEKPLDRALGIILWGMFLVVFPGMVSPGTAEVVKGRVTSVQGDGLETDIGSAKGLGIGDVGRIFYTIKIEGKETSIFVGELKITSVSEKSSKAQIQEKRA
jgi:DNA-directed RNA polymerase subunit E'/Rpb7